MSDSTTHRVLVRSWATVGTFVALWMVGLVLARIWPACQLLLGGVIVGFACSPVTNWLEDRHVPRGMAALLALLLVLGVLVGVAIMLVPPVIDQMLELNRTVEPNPEAVAAYGPVKEAFEVCYKAMLPVYEYMASHKNV